MLPQGGVERLGIAAGALELDVTIAEQGVEAGDAFLLVGHRFDILNQIGTNALELIQFTRLNGDLRPDTTVADALLRFRLGQVIVSSSARSRR